MLRTFALIYLLLFVRLLAPAQSPLGLGSITIEQGLPQGYVSSICQDSEGFMWFGTIDGLCRYDGYEFLVFRHDPYDPRSISHNAAVLVLEVDSFLLVVTYAGVDLLDRKTRQFFHILPENVKTAVSDGRQTLYFLTKKNALQRLTLTPETIAQLRTAGPETLPFEDLSGGTAWRAMHHSENGRYLWLLKPNGLELCRFDPVSRQIKCFPVPERKELFRIKSAGAGGLWLEGQNSLTYFDATGSNNPWRFVRTTVPLKSICHFDPLKQMLWVDVGEICGFKFDVQHLPDAIGPEQAKIRLNIPEGVVHSLTDRYGMVWFGTNAHGIRLFNPRAAAFVNYLPGHSIYSTPFVDTDGAIWLGRINSPATQNISGHSLNLTTGKLTPFPFLASPPEMVASTTVSDDAGNRWTGGKCRGKPLYKLVRYNPGSRQTEEFVFPVDPPFYFDVLVMRYEAPDAVWMYLPYQMRRLDTRTRQWTTYDYRALTNGEQSVVAVAVTADGSQWIALSQGIIRAQPDGKGGFRYSMMKNDPANRNSLPINNIKCLLTDPADAHVLWIGTGGGGLSRLDTRTGLFAPFTTQNGLPNNVVYGIVAESPPPPEGQVFWLSTNKGLARFNPATRKFQYFMHADGLPGNEFNMYAYGKMPNGRLIFGGVNGLTIFDPKDLSPNTSAPGVYLTAMRINGLPVEPNDSTALLTQGIEYTGTLHLSHAQNNLVLQFAALDFANPERNQFQFFLEGAEAAWSHRGFEHTAQYLNLSPGTYTFRVKAANSDGVWNDVPATLRIEISPPWYASWWAYALYALLVIATAYTFYQTQLRRRLAQAETLRLRELDLVKSRLYNNITHEFRTPLTVILGVSEQVKQFLKEQGAKGQTALLEQVQRNGSQLLRLINQLLDLSKLESGKMTLHWERGDVVTYLRYITESFHSYAAGQGIQLHFASETDSIEMDYDPEKLQTILVNLLSNAIKFTPSGGRILVQIEETEEKSEPWLSLQVQDTGTGIESEKLSHIFDRFYQADDSPTRQSGGTGIGLALVRELVLLQEGRVFANSPGRDADTQGAVFTVLLPVRRHPDTTIPVRPADFSDLPAPFMLPEDAPAHVPDDESDKRPVVLIVEDHAEVADYVVSCLHDTYRTLLARNGRTGIEQALEYIPDLIVSDVMMPEKDGFEVCELLKNDERTSHIPIVLLTARAGVEDRISGLRRGADAYLAKPFHPEELRVVLANLLELRQKLQAKYSKLGLRHVDSGVPDAQTPALKNTEPDQEDVFLQKLRAVVESRLSQTDLSVEEISRMVGMSYPVVHRKVTALTGRSLTLYMRAVRLQQARILLADPALSIADVAYETGFNDPKFFSRVFSEEYRMTPSAFRQSLRI